MADSSATNSNGSNKLVVILLVLNLLVAIAALAHVVYYIPQDGNSAMAEPTVATELIVDGVGNIGMSPRGIELEMIELNQNNPTGAPRVVQTVSMSQEAFLNTLGRMSLLRERLVEKELVREVE